jgi:arylsulfatase A-like enzyme
MQPSRRTFLKRATAGALTKPFVSYGQRQRQPNVLFILADEWRAQATGYNGDPNVSTPVLDRLARESASFQNAVSCTPVCCPARASLMTGQYPLTNGVFINDVELKPRGETLAQVFSKAGYHTGYIGKWHLYGSPDGNYGRRLAFIPKDKRLGFEYWKACECSHEYNHSLYFEGNDPTPKYWPGYDAIAQTDDACRFIETNARQPFFLFLSLGPPHFPYETAPEPYRSQYADRTIQFRPNVPDEQHGAARAILRGYSAHIAALDACFDKLLRTLERLNIADDTIVVFTSDHGDMMLSQGLTTKLYPWDESIRVPFLVRYPRKLGRRGAKITTPLNYPDIMPTLLGLADLKIPDGVQGFDHSSQLGPQKANSKQVFPPGLLTLPAPITEARRYGIAEYRGLRTERYTYVRSIHGPWLLYDNAADPYQMHSLIGQASQRDLQNQLDHALNKQLKDISDEFLPAKEYIQRANVGHYKEVNVPVGHIHSPWGDWESTLERARS